jgi:SnoaL-like protein
MLHPNAAVIERLFRALNAHDAEAMVACYHHRKVRFRDIAFNLRSKPKIHSMWRMICEGDSDIKVSCEIVEADERRVVAKITDDYYFGRDIKNQREGKHVVNTITSYFTIRDELIATHVDDCDPRAWADQALDGWRGWIAGRVRLARAVVAYFKLRAFLKEHPIAKSSAARGSVTF